MNAISLKDVWLKYRIEFKENGKVVPEDFWALREINIDIDKGEAICIIGENGAGKSTLLKIIVGMLKPDKGSVQVNGTVSGLMEIGAGFQRDLTGAENIYLVSSLFGLAKKQIDERYNDIVKFAAIGRFINAPVRSYSQGMYMRLAFAIAVYVDPEILLIDDIFVVGDIYAQRKCTNMIFEFKKMGKTIVFVTQNLEMAKRICSRGIFLRNGEIVKDGSIDKVCSYYEETVGNKKGIALLQAGLLGIVFNNGKLILRWNDNTITTDLSGHSNMLFLGREYLSTTADWQVQELKEEKGIVAIGRWPDIPVTQYWKIFSLNEEGFLWETMIQMSAGTFPKKYETRMVFTDKYKKWFTLDSEKDFPESFIHEEQWQCTPVEDSVNTVIGLKGSTEAALSLPVVIFDGLQDNNRKTCCIGNTGSEISGRALLYSVFPEASNVNNAISEYRCLLSKIIIFEPEAKEKLEFYFNQAKQIMQESTVVRKDPLSISCKDHRIEIRWQDRLLTTGVGLNTQFRYQDENYSALNGHWVIRKEKDEEIIITVSWDDKPPFSQIWRLKLHTDNTILWEIEMDIDEKIKLRNKQVELLLGEEYEKWITTEERGSFDRLEKKGCGVVLNKYINVHIGVEGIDNKDGFFLPGVLFNYEDGAPRVSSISQIKEEARGTKLSYLEIDSKENFYTLPGNNKYFSGKVRVVTDKETRNELIKISDKKPGIVNYRPDSFSKIEYNRISLFFDYAKGRIFWDGMELTKGLGLYSSVFFRDIWYDSSQAFWEITKLDKDRLVAIGQWAWIPMAQNWELSLLDEKTLLWKITRETWEDAVLEREQVGLMLSDKYKEWFSYKQIHNEFPKRFIEHNGIFWDRLWCGNSMLPIGIKKCKIKKGISNRQSLPSVTFECLTDYCAWHSIIENTDNLFQSRVLQYELNLSQGSNRDKNKYFEGQIKIVT